MQISLRRTLHITGLSFTSIKKLPSSVWEKSYYTAVLQLWCCVSENVWGCRLARQRLRRRWWCWRGWLGRWLSPLMMMMMVIILKMETVWAWHVTWGRVRDQKGRKLQRHEPPPYKGAPDPFVQFFQHRVFIHNFILIVGKVSWFPIMRHYISWFYTILTISRTTSNYLTFFLSKPGPQTVSQLLVQRATLSDSGTYTCQVSYNLWFVREGFK